MMKQKQTKKCNRCGLLKLRSDFYNDKSKPDNMSFYCKICHKEIQRLFRKTHPGLKHKVDRNSALNKKYKITLKQYEIILEAQNFICAICKKPEVAVSTRDRIKSLAVDHDHKTGRIRGLLCNKCNTRLGVLENLQWRLLAERYLNNA